MGIHPPCAALVFRHAVASERGVWLARHGIIVLLSLEVAATLLLLGAQVIAEYERIETGEAEKPGAKQDKRPLSAS